MNVSSARSMFAVKLICCICFGSASSASILLPIKSLVASTIFLFDLFEAIYFEHLL